MKLFNDIYSGKKVLITGHTGFKGSWLNLWLNMLGAKTCGVSLPPDSSPNHFELLKPSGQSHFIDIRDREKLNELIVNFRPDIVFHLAAQPLVRRSYENPVETYETNVMGTLNVLEACRKTNDVKAIIIATTDKVYENKEWVWGYRENDPVGGYDPYSSSKGCAEILISSYRNSFFNLNEYGKSHNALLGSCRAGNVIGGGDWAEDRLLPDAIRSTVMGKTTEIRNPLAIRPWQHVLDPLRGYLLLGQKLLERNVDFAQAWNFGPDDESNLPVKDVMEEMKLNWNQIKYEVKRNEKQPHEANILKLDCSKAKTKLGWTPVWGIKESVKATCDWYRNFYDEKQLITEKQITDFCEKI